MGNLLICIISVLSMTSFLAMFFIDYKKDKYWLASLELAIAIICITCGVCSAWDFTLKALT